MQLPDELAGLVRRQWGLFTKAQAAHCGLSPGALAWRLGRQWELVLPGVVHVDRSPLRLSQRMLAALLYAGPEAAVSGASAAWWYGLSHVPEPRVIQVEVPPPGHTRQARWADVRRSRVPDARIRQRDPLRFVSPERAVVQGARAAHGGEAATALVIEAVQRRLCTLDRLAHTNELLGRRYSAQASAAIREAALGAWSIPEARLGELVRSSTVLPPMWCNPQLRAPGGMTLLSPDGWFDDVGLAVMVHSRLHHDAEGFDETIVRDGELAAYGISVVGLTPRVLAREGEQVLRRIERAYVTARTAGVRPLVTATRRAAWSAPAQSS